MPIKPHEFLTQSQLLIQTPDEVDHRSAVSRAYYAALHGAIDVCKQVLGGIHLSSGANTHQKVIDKLQSSSRDSSYSPALRSQIGAVSLQLIKGRKLRVRADYRINGTMPLPYAINHIASMARTLAQTDIILSQNTPPP